MANVYTYNPKQVKISLGNHIVTGYAEDSFVQIEPHSDGTQVKVGCDGEINRAISVDNAFNVKIALLQDSPTSKWLREKFRKDQVDGTGTFPITVRDIMGEEKFTCSIAWVNREAAWGRGRDTTNREWDLTCGDGKFATT